MVIWLINQLKEIRPKQYWNVGSIRWICKDDSNVKKQKINNNNNKRQDDLINIKKNSGGSKKKKRVGVLKEIRSE